MRIEQGELFPGTEPTRKPTLRNPIEVHPAVSAYALAHMVAFEEQVTRKADTTEVASVWKAEFLDKISINSFPNFSSVIRYRSNGEGIDFYDTMLGTDPDLRGLFQDVADDVLHNERVIRPAEGKNPAYAEHADFIRFAFAEIPHFQNFVDHSLTCHPRGFSVNEKVYKIVDRGRWAGAVIYGDIFDTRQRWWNFGINRELRLKTVLNPDPGQRVDPRKFVVMSHGSNSNPWGHAVLDDTYWAWYLKHFALKNQAIFFEKWAQPTPRAKYKHSKDEKVNKQRLDSALEAIAAFQADSGVAIPEEIELDLIESLRQGAISYEAYINQLTEMESRAVTGQILTMFGAKGGSYALGKVHEKRISNKVEKLSAFSDSQVSRQLIRDLIDRNYGQQDGYPRSEILSMHPLEKQAHAEVEKALQQNGHTMSKSWSSRFFQLVPPVDKADELVPPENAQASQTLPVNPTLAAEPGETARVLLLSQGYGDLHAAAHAAATEHRRKLDGIAVSTTKDSLPAIRKTMKAITGKLRARKNLSSITRADLHRAVKGSDLSALGSVMHRVIHGPEKVSSAVAMAAEAPDISNSAKLALALQVEAIIEAIYGALGDASAEMAVADFLDALTDPDSVALDERLANIFGATHPTNIATIATARLRRQLADPAFRKAHPYVMVVVTNPNARLSHKMMNGYIITAEEALYSSYLPPFGFGCDCVPVALTAAQARAAGLTGGAPVGTLEEFLAAQGIRPSSYGGYITPGGMRVTPGPESGFAPSFTGTDLYVQLDALRTKARELQNTDPSAWAEFHGWLIWLFGIDVLKQDPQEDSDVAA